MLVFFFCVRRIVEYIIELTSILRDEKEIKHALHGIISESSVTVVKAPD